MEALNKVDGDQNRSNDLLSCPDCGADPIHFCKIEFTKGRETHNKNTASARCISCGFYVAMRTGGKPVFIRTLWNSFPR